MDLIDRKYRILQAIIDDYILTALPVGSRTISRKYEQKLSSRHHPQRDERALRSWGTSTPRTRRPGASLPTRHTACMWIR